jgi:DNA-binding CsgD family transcriptional regulator
MVGDGRAVRWSRVSAPAFVGREREVAVLGQALSRPPAVVLIEAEPGAGKSRLVQEFLASPDGRRHRMLVAVCPPFREALTLGPIVDAVRQARDGVAGLRLSALTGALRPLLPEWAADLPPSPEPLEDTKAARHRLFRALAELIGALDATGLVVEDVHWADPVTLEFLVFLAAHQSPQPLSLVVTYREAEVAADSPMRRLSSRLPAGTTQVRVALAPLDVAETANLVSSMLDGERVSSAFATFLHERTGGVPLAVEESVRLLNDRADLVRVERAGEEGGEWVRRSLADLQVSPTIRDSVLERAQRLSRPAHRLLQAAAVLAEATDAAVVTTVAGLADQPERDPLTEVVGSGLLQEDNRARLAFRHAFMAQAVYEAIPGAERRRLHLLAGQALERLDPLPVVQLTRHFREANEIAKWCQYAEAAAGRAVASGDRTTATRLLDELLGTAELPGPARVRLAQLLATNALVRREAIDDLHRGVIRTLRGVIDTGLPPVDQAKLRSRLGRLLGQQGDIAAARAELERAIPHLDPHSGDAARAMVYLGWPWFGPGPASEHLEWLRRAAGIDLDRLCPADRLAVIGDRAAALIQLGEEAGWEVAAGLPTEAAGADQRRQLVRINLNLSYGAIRWGRYVVARERFAAAARLADTFHYPRLHANFQVVQADLAWFTGAWEGLAQQATANLLDTQDGEPLVHSEANCLAGRLHAAQGTHRKAEECFRTALEGAHGLGSAEHQVEPAAALGRLWLAEGRVEEALAVTEEPIEPVATKGIWVWATDIAPVRVEALVAAGRLDEAVALVSAYDRGMRGRDAPAPQAGLAACRAVLAAAQGRPDLAHAGLFARAAQAWEQLPRPYDALRAREREAGCLLDAGQSGAGVELLSEVWQRLTDLGARGDADRVARRLREHGADVRRPWRGGRRGYGSQPSPRELEVVRLVLAGKTNREIAQALSKSPRTVAGQLGSVMRKLGVSSRTELAVRVVEAGLIPDEG